MLRLQKHSGNRPAAPYGADKNVKVLLRHLRIAKIATFAAFD